jgi:hypothetical protein
MDNYDEIVGTSKEEVAERRMLQVRAGIIK